MTAPVVVDVVVAGTTGGSAEQHGIAQVWHGSGEAGTGSIGHGSEPQHETGAAGSTSQQFASVVGAGGATQQESGASKIAELSGPQTAPHSPLETSCPRTANRMARRVSIRSLIVRMGGAMSRSAPGIDV